MGILSSLFNTSSLLEMLYRLPAIIIALSCHEWAHAYAAYRLGDPTARNLGRMTINPLAHFDPLGFIMLILVRFGWAKPVPINIRNFKKPRRDSIIVSLAGVGMNILIAFVTMGLDVLLSALNIYNAAISSMIYYLYFINLGLFVFNLLPIPPLDGYRVLEALLLRKVGYKPFEFLERYGFIILIALLLTGVLTNIMTFLVNAIATGMASIYAFILGWA